MIPILEYKKNYSDIDEAIANFTFGTDLVVVDNLPFGWEEIRTPSQLEDYLETSSPYEELLACDSVFDDYILVRRDRRDPYRVEDSTGTGYRIVTTKGQYGVVYLDRHGHRYSLYRKL